jgi:hypothetical protein
MGLKFGNSGYTGVKSLLHFSLFYKKYITGDASATKNWNISHGMTMSPSSIYLVSHPGYSNIWIKYLKSGEAEDQ